MNDINRMQKELARVSAELAAARENEVAGALAAFKEQIEAYSLSEAEVLAGLGFTKRRRKQSAPTSGRVWTSPEKQPKWLTARQRERSAKG